MRIILCVILILNRVRGEFMNNKLFFSLYEKAIGNVPIETVFDIINLYGDKCIDGIEINSRNMPLLKKCALLCKKNRFLFRCHFPLEEISENDTVKYLNFINELSKELRYKINIVFHSKFSQDEILDDMINETNLYINNILNYVKKYKLNLYISLENLNYRNGVKRINISKIDNILKDNENLYFTYDIGHDLYDNKICTKLSSLQISKLNNVHIHSVEKNEDHHIITKNSQNLDKLKEVLNDLESIKYSGPIVLEYSLEHINAKSAEEKIIEIVKSFKFFKNELL